MDRLPQELVLEILSRLPLPSLGQSKSVCRAWRILIQDRVFVDKHFKRTADNDSTLPKLSLFRRFLNPDENDGRAMMITKRLSMPPIPNFHLVSSCDGFLCLRATYPSFQLCIYNPFTRDYIELPKLSHRAGNLSRSFYTLVCIFLLLLLSSFFN
ncbi:hypothetical protein GQ457_06G027380 [Hibiscus cannabinus]